MAEHEIRFMELEEKLGLYAKNIKHNSSLIKPNLEKEEVESHLDITFNFIIFTTRVLLKKLAFIRQYLHTEVLPWGK